MSDAKRESSSNVSDKISELLKSRLGRVHVVSVEVREEYDPDGDPVLHIVVLYETDDTEFDASKLSGLLRHLRPELFKDGESRFPVISFISQEDYAATA